ncbi:MAG: sulfite exporter TauE/SafE family protein [Chlorobi bacterium]|nr:sulfite exporter TauE/SafE family protein [Chlorobiota bacterium]
MTNTTIAMFVTGLAGGFGHCISMCGPVVAAYSLGETRRGMLHHLLYNAGRVTTYTVLGAIVGLSGSFLVLAASIDRFQTIIMVLAGISIILMGLATLDILPVGKTINSCSWIMPRIGKLMGLFKGSRSIGAYYPMGVLLGFLPCGLTYTALLAAARAAMNADNHVAGMLEGGLIMLSFGLGTTPALLVVGKAVHLIGEKVRRTFHRVAGAIMILTGIYFTLSAL